MARVAYAIVKHGSDYQRFFEQRIPRTWKPTGNATFRKDGIGGGSLLDAINATGTFFFEKTLALA